MGEVGLSFHGSMSHETHSRVSLVTLFFSLACANHSHPHVLAQ